MALNCSEFQTTQLQFHFNLLKEIVLTKPTDSFLYSPISISLALGLIFLGANNETKKELKKKMLLNNISDDVFYKCQENFLHSLQNFSDNLIVENKIYIENNVQLNENFIKKYYKIYSNEIEKLNFSNPDVIAKNMNNFIEKKTKNNILNSINLTSLKTDSLTILNTMNFNASWLKPFPNIDFESNFYDDQKNSKKIYMATQHHLFKFYETTKMQVLVLPYIFFNENINYINSNYDMYIILPKTLTLNNFLKNLTFQGFINIINFVKNIRSSNLEIYLPQFHMESKLNITEILQNFGIKKIFSSNLDSISNNKILKVDKILQKVFFEINKKGATATSSKIIYLQNFFSKVNVKNFVVNHSFLYFVVDKNKNFMFNGVYRGT